MSDAVHQDERARLWTPSEESIRGSRMHDFAQWVSRTRGVPTEGFDALHAWSVEDLEAFWGAVWEYCGIVASSEATAALEDRSMPGACWFPGTRLNYAENTLRWAESRPEEVAIVGEHEDGAPVSWTWRELESRVAALAQRLRELGVGRGDRVAGVLPNIPETVVALLATASVGALWSVVNTDFGPSGVADRFAQIEPSVLFVVDGYRFGGSLRDMTGSYAGLLDVLPSVQQLIVVDQQPSGAVKALPEGALRLSEILECSAVPRYEQVPFEHPLWILYSSGTTGKPKGIVHSHGGVVLEFHKALGLHAGLGPEDIAYYAVATTWMVWNMLVGILLTGARIIHLRRVPDPRRPGEVLRARGAAPGHVLRCGRGHSQHGAARRGGPQRPHGPVLPPIDPGHGLPASRRRLGLGLRGRLTHGAPRLRLGRHRRHERVHRHQSVPVRVPGRDHGPVPGCGRGVLELPRGARVGRGGRAGDHRPHAQHAGGLLGR